MNKIIQFAREAHSELKKSTWLSKKEVIQSTILVFVVVVMVAAYVNAVDFGLSIILKSILGGR
ncbi:MAG: preprotein translocase subunit SecE [Elusimicrobia bacterium]|nr:preprotein translocase subunit SecE [Elusimicrobiota bacterium]